MPAPLAYRRILLKLSGAALMGSEDFSRVLAEVPGCYLFVGACPGDPNASPGNHAPGARFDDSVLGDCARLLAELAVRDLAAGGVGG